MDGLDLHDILLQRIHFTDVLALQVPYEAGTGEVFAGTRDLNIYSSTS